MSKSFLIRNARLLEKGHPDHLQRVDILVSDGVISEIGQNLNAKEQTELIEGGSLIATAGWVDMRCHLSDPGNEHKDTLEDLLNTAVYSGFTSVLTLPDSSPTIRDKSGINYLTSQANDHIVSLLPTGAVAAGADEDNLAELFDMFGAGALAFTEGDEPISNGLLKKALLYTKPFGGVIMSRPGDRLLERGGTVNESENTLNTGLKTSASLAEYITVQAQLEIAKYCECPIHFSALSCKESVEKVRVAKQAGIKVTCDVAIANLCFTDESVLTFNENFKLYPPLRTEADRAALIEGVNDGTIDAISSNHSPQNVESKKVEFDYAEFGALSLQFVLPWYKKYLSSDIKIEKFIECITSKPAELLGLKSTKVQLGELANLTVFDDEASWTFDPSTNKSSSRNSHEWGEEQNGRVVAVFNNRKIKTL